MNQTNKAIGPNPGNHPKQFDVDPDCPFPVGVEYYRPPVPPRQFWDDDFARIRATGMRIVRSFPFWNWLEPRPGQFEFDDLDYFFELAVKHDLKVWLDITVATHGACPEWMLRMHPDMRVIWPDGRVQQQTANVSTPQGQMVHNYDHPKWREYAERCIQAIVNRYKDHPNLLVWGTCDGVNFAAAWAEEGKGYPPYNDYTIEKYIQWLKAQFTLEELNERLMRRYRCWEDVQPPRNNDAPVEMMLYRQFHYENMADMLGWMVKLIERLDGRHEQRSHGWFFPRQWDEMASEQVDSWGLSMPSGNRLTSDDPYIIAANYLGFDWSRAIGRGHRWWLEEIYAGFVGGLAARDKQSTPEELTLFLWLSLIAGAAGAMFWQYRPEYMSFEGPGLNLVALDGTPTQRWLAIEQALRQIDSIKKHLPLEIPPAEVAWAYSAPSHEIFMYAGDERRFISDSKRVYQNLWSSSIPQDIVTPRMDWSQYKVVYLPNFAVLDDIAIKRIREVLQNCPQTHMIAEGHFGTFAGKGHWSFAPPEGLADLVNVRVMDFDMITAKDIREGRNILTTKFGKFPITSECKYAVLKPQGNTETIATLNGAVVGVETARRRLSWWGLSLSYGFGGVGAQALILPLFNSYGVGSPFTISGDRLVAFRRISKLGGSLIFLLNLEPTAGKAEVKANWRIGGVSDLIGKKEVHVAKGIFQVKIPPGGIKVFHTVDV
ncbi:MAG: beta-galactosidase [Kiritimatiellaeota bacterium]|nr:beta-galactosidase [Kiritimatiellota bacterium]